MSEPAPHLRAIDSGGQTASRENWNGVTSPRRRGGSGRFLTDVLVELGFTERDRAQKAIEDARSAGIPPERVLLEQRAITSEQLAQLQECRLIWAENRRRFLGSEKTSSVTSADDQSSSPAPSLAQPKNLDRLPQGWPPSTTEERE